MISQAFELLGQSLILKDIIMICIDGLFVASSASYAGCSMCSPCHIYWFWSYDVWKLCYSWDYEMEEKMDCSAKWTAWISGFETTTCNGWWNCDKSEPSTIWKWRSRNNACHLICFTFWFISYSQWKQKMEWFRLYFSIYKVCHHHSLLLLLF